MDQFRLINQQQQPFIQSGYGAMGRLNTLLGINPRPDYQTSPATAGPQLSPQIQAILEGNAGTPMSRALQSAMRGAVGSGQSAGPAGPGYMPTASGGVRRIAQVDPNASGYAPPINNQMSRMKDLLALRAANGDRQAQAMLQRMV
jgi:hypothetical protein